MKNICNLVCSADEEFAMPLTVMLKSLEEFSSSFINVYILNGGITDKSKYKIDKSLKNKITYIDLKDVSFEFEHKVQLSKTTYYRLLIPDIFGESVQKVLYLDGDILVLKDIYNLWNIELNSFAIGAVPEMDMEAWYVSSKFGLPSYKLLNIPSYSRYFNAGVLLINLDKWRKQNISKRIFYYLKEYQEHVLWNDQDGLNAILWDDWKKLDYTWNIMSPFFRYKEKEILHFGEDNYYKIKNEPSIIHFNQRSKPWDNNCVHPYRKIFNHYFLQTVWSDWSII